MNRQTKRAMKRQGGETPAPSERRRPATPPPHRERATAKEFVREVRGELKKVAWPTKAEVGGLSRVREHVARSRMLSVRWWPAALLRHARETVCVGVGQVGRPWTRPAWVHVGQWLNW